MRSPSMHWFGQRQGLPNVSHGPVLPHVNVSSRYRPASPSPPPMEMLVGAEKQKRKLSPVQA
eukprot:scaffold60417_cov54-Phaeocystis_antarctica.AAC.2